MPSMELWTKQLMNDWWRAAYVAFSRSGSGLSSSCFILLREPTPTPINHISPKAINCAPRTRQPKVPPQRLLRASCTVIATGKEENIHTKWHRRVICVNITPIQFCLNSNHNWRFAFITLEICLRAACERTSSPSILSIWIWQQRQQRIYVSHKSFKHIHPIRALRFKCIGISRLFDCKQGKLPMLPADHIVVGSVFSA